MKPSTSRIAREFYHNDVIFRIFMSICFTIKKLSCEKERERCEKFYNGQSEEKTNRKLREIVMEELK